MASLLRKLSLRKSTAESTPAPDAAPTINNSQAQPFPIESLIPRDFVIKTVGPTSAIIHYALPPTCTLQDTVDLRIFVRPAKAFRTASEAASVIQRELTNLNLEYNMANNRNRMKPGFNQHEAFVAHSKVVNAVRARLDAVWTSYAAQCKELLHLPEPSAGGYEGWFLYNAEHQSFAGLQTPRASAPASLIGIATETNNVVEIGNLASNCFFESSWQAKPTHAAATGEDGEVEWGPMSARISFSTKSAPWQAALEKAGLRQLIDPFSAKGLSTFSSWLGIADNTELKMELGIDSAMELILQDILSANGVITPAEQARIDRERREMSSVVANLLAELGMSKSVLSVGDAVLESTTGRFGVLTSSPDQAQRVSVRWEDARSKDPANSLVENGVDTSKLERKKFTLFMSHAQAEAQNQVAHLSVLLRDKEAKIWFDMDSERLEARDMVRGIANSETVLLYLTRSYFDRYFCRMELSVARALEKPMVIVYEPDERFGGTSDYVRLVSQCTQKYPEFRDFLLSSEAIPMARRAFQRRAVVDEICKRSGFHSPAEQSSSSSATSNGNKMEEGTGGGGGDVANLRSMMLDLRMDINDLKAENKELREMVEALVKRLDEQ